MITLLFEVLRNVLRPTKLLQVATIFFVLSLFNCRTYIITISYCHSECDSKAWIWSCDCNRTAAAGIEKKKWMSANGIKNGLVNIYY